MHINRDCRTENWRWEGETDTTYIRKKQKAWNNNSKRTEKNKLDIHYYSIQNSIEPMLISQINEGEMENNFFKRFKNIFYSCTDSLYFFGVGGLAGVGDMPTASRREETGGH